MGPAVVAAFTRDPNGLGELLTTAGYQAVRHYRRRGMLPFAVAAQVPGLLGALGVEDKFAWRGGRNPIPARFAVDTETAWLLGLYVAEGYRREQQVVVSNTDQRILDRAGDALARLGLTFHRGPEALTVGSAVFSALLGWMGTGGKAPTKRVPPAVFGWPQSHLRAFLDGIVDGDGSPTVDARRCGRRPMVWWVTFCCCSPGLAGGRGVAADRPDAMPSR